MKQKNIIKKVKEKTVHYTTDALGVPLDPEEQWIEDHLEEFKRVKNFDEMKKKAIDAARATLKKTANINIRIQQENLYKLKEIALKEGLGYQTLISSILHKYVNQHYQE